MAYLFLSDGGPEASEYSNNYFRFNESDTRTLNRLIQVLKGRDPADPELRLLVESICKSSYSDNINVNPTAGLLMDRIRSALEKASRFFSVMTRPEYTFH